MKTLILVFAVNLTYLSLTAQPEISLNWIPLTGDEWKQTALLERPDPGAAGAEATWDFSDVPFQPVSELIFHWIEPEMTQYSDLFPDATLAVDLELSGFGRGFAYGYYQTDGLGISYLGSGTEYGTDVYSDPQFLAFIGLQFGETFEDDYAGTRTNVFTGSQPFVGEISYTYDAYGTLLLPGVTIDDAIRIFQLDTQADFSDNGGGVEMVTRDSIKSYAWIADGSVFPVAQWQRTITRIQVFLNGMLLSEEIEGPDTTFAINPDYGMISGIADQTALKTFNLYPTIAMNQVELQAEQNVTEDYMIYTMNGTPVEGGSLSGGAVSLNVQHLRPGLYLVFVDGYVPKWFVKK